MNPECRFEYLFGSELQTRMAQASIAWVPLGPLEKHGEHLPWGLDGLKAHAQCLRLAAKHGGVVLPAVHVAGIHTPWDPDPGVARAKQAEVGDFYLREDTLLRLAEDVVDGLANIGFKLIVLNSGHFPAYQGKLLKELAARMQATCPAKILAFDEQDVVPRIDHAGTYETSMLMALGFETHVERARPEHADRIGYFSSKTPPSAASVEKGLAWLEQIDRYFADIIPRLRQSG